MSESTRRALGATGLYVGPITVGAAGWQRRPDGTGSDETETRALGHLLAEAEMTTVLDTSNNYGYGESESRIGQLRETNPKMKRVLVQTKADRAYGTNDFSRRRMFESLRESSERLQMDSLPLVYLHDPENTTWEMAMASDGPVRALLDAKEKGIIQHLGISGGPAGLLLRFVETGHFESLITHNRFTLLDRSADELITRAHEAGLGVMNAAPYGGGILTAWPPPRTRYAYGEAAAPALKAAGAFAGLCDEYSIPLAALALHWSLRDERITSTIVGMERPSDWERTVHLLKILIPDEVWERAELIQLDRSTWQDA